MNETINLEITKEEAVVLFEFLSRFSDKDIISIEHQSEERALWNLHCTFEKIINEAFSGDYKKALESARESLKDG